MLVNSVIEVLLSVYSAFSPMQKAYYDSIFAPTVVGAPPTYAVRDMCVRPDGEIRHYGWKEVCGKKARVYVASRDLGLNWTTHFAAADDHGAY